MSNATTHSDPCQVDQVLAYLTKNPKGITAREASRKLNIDRLGARIFEIIDGGQPIVKTWEKTRGGKSVIRYSLP